MAAYLCSRSGCDVYVDTPQRYCESHRCAADACRNAKRSASRFCNEHLECRRIGCRTARYHPDSDEESAPFCADHWWSCRDFDCTAWANNSANSPYCTAHGCQFPMCQHPVSTGLQSCTTHACTFSQCVKPIREGLRACLDHACQNPGCQYPVSDGRTACLAHICRITALTCNEMGADYHQGRYYCIDHTCNVSGCFERTLDPGTATAQTFTKCSRHRCAAQQCSQVRRENSDYCHNHALCGKSGCEAIKNINDRFCAAHIDTCIHVSCPNTRQEYGHTEWWDPGVFRSWRSYYVRDGLREYCTNHACEMAQNGCELRREENSTLCDQHRRCAALRCTAVCTSPQEACPQHSCYVQSCSRAVCSLDCRYCQDRKLKGLTYPIDALLIGYRCVRARRLLRPARSCF
jgi:hypothetical protein